MNHPTQGVLNLIRLGPHDEVLQCKQRIRDTIRASIMFPDRHDELQEELSALLIEYTRLTNKQYNPQEDCLYARDVHGDV